MSVAKIVASGVTTLVLLCALACQRACFFGATHKLVKGAGLVVVGIG